MEFKGKFRKLGNHFMRRINREAIKNKPIIFYSASFLQNVSYGIVGPLFVLYLLSIKFNPGQIGIIFAAERVSTLSFEIPTGGFADRYGRRKSLFISFLMTSFMLPIWFLTQNFFILLIAAILWGLAYTLQSGAEESFIIDSLKLAKDDSKRNKVFSQVSMSGNFGFFVGGLLGALLAFYSLRSIWLVTPLLNILVFILYFLFTKEEYSQQKFSKDKRPLLNLFTLIKRSLIFVLKNKIILIFLIITFIWSLAWSFYALGYPVLLKKVLEIPAFWFGLLGSLSALMGIVGAFWAERSTKRFGFIFTLMSFSFAASLLLILFGLVKVFVIALILFSSIAIIEGGRYPIYQSFLNKFIPSKKRATLLSINSALSTSASAIGELSAGFLLTLLYPGYILIISGLLYFSIPFLFYFLFYKVNKKIKEPC